VRQAFPHVAGFKHKSFSDFVVQCTSKYTQRCTASQPEAHKDDEAARFFTAARQAMQTAPAGLPLATVPELEWMEHGVSALYQAGEAQGAAGLSGELADRITTAAAGGETPFAEAVTATVANHAALEELRQLLKQGPGSVAARGLLSTLNGKLDLCASLTVKAVSDIPACTATDGYVQLVRLVKSYEPIRKLWLANGGEAGVFPHPGILPSLEAHLVAYAQLIHQGNYIVMT